VGIDEGTVLMVTPDGMWSVLGRSAIIVVDARGATITRAASPLLGATNMRVSVLPAGSTYDPRTGAVLLPNSTQAGR
jgi:cyanophycinase